MFHEDGGGEDGDQMVHEVGLVLKQLRRLFLHGGLQRLCVGRGYAVPCLGLSPGDRQDGGSMVRRCIKAKSPWVFTPFLYSTCIHVFTSEGN